MQVRIYRAARSAMQAGGGRSRRWMLEFEESHVQKKRDPLMGWVRGTDTTCQMCLLFDNKEEAVNYARRHGYVFTIAEPYERHLKPKSYADNFRTDRLY